MTSLRQEIVSLLATILWFMETLERQADLHEKRGFDPEGALTARNKDRALFIIRRADELIEEYQESDPFYRQMCEDIEDVSASMYGEGKLSIEQYTALEFDVPGYDEEEIELSNLQDVIVHIGSREMELKSILQQIEEASE